MPNSTRLVGILLLLLVVLSGCAEGPFWQMGKLSPWVREKWAAEARVADTLFERKRKMNESVSAVALATADQQETVAAELLEIVRRDPVLLRRLHAVKLLGKLNCKTSRQALIDASSDPDADVRIAAVGSWMKMPGNIAISQLQEIVGSDTNVDVRLAATRALGNFTGKNAVQALALVLTDNDPALQFRATESLAQVTGESFGPDVRAWQNYAKSLAEEPATQMFQTERQSSESSVLPEKSGSLR